MYSPAVKFTVETIKTPRALESHCHSVTRLAPDLHQTCIRLAKIIKDHQRSNGFHLRVRRVQRGVKDQETRRDSSRLVETRRDSSRLVRSRPSGNRGRCRRAACWRGFHPGQSCRVESSQRQRDMNLVHRDMIWRDMKSNEIRTEPVENHRKPILEGGRCESQIRAGLIRFGCTGEAKSRPRNWTRSGAQLRNFRQLSWQLWTNFTLSKCSKTPSSNRNGRNGPCENVWSKMPKCPGHVESKSVMQVSLVSQIETLLEWSHLTESSLEMRKLSHTETPKCNTKKSTWLSMTVNGGHLDMLQCCCKHALQASKGGMSPVELVPKHGNRSLGSQASLRASLVLCTLCHFMWPHHCRTCTLKSVC
jgi:hypothetical protein